MSKNPVKDKPLITVKTINQSIVDQLYPGRGELGRVETVGASEFPIGQLGLGGDLLFRDEKTGHVRLVWRHNYALALIKCGKTKEEAEALLAPLPQIFTNS